MFTWYVMLCMLCYVMLCYVMLRYVCYVMLCYVCYVMLCYVMLCYAMLYYLTSSHFTLSYVFLTCLDAQSTLLYFVSFFSAMFILLQILFFIKGVFYSQFLTWKIISSTQQMWMGDSLDPSFALACENIRPSLLPALQSMSQDT